MPQPLPGLLKVKAGPCNVSSPQQNYKLHAEVDYEEGVILLSYTVLNPGAVMVIAPNTVLAQLAVLGSHWLLHHAVAATPYLHTA